MRSLKRRARARARPFVRAGRALLRGDISIDELSYGHMMSMSQFGEDVVLAQLFVDQPMGFYVDVGALDPFAYSNTYELWRRGWRGINIEPQPDQLAQFDRHRPGDVNLCVAISQSPGVGRLAVNGSFSGLDTDRYLWGGSDEHQTIEVPLRSLAATLDEHLPDDTPIDLLDVDCEGHDGDVLLSNDWERFRPRVVLAERHGEASEGEDPTDILLSHGYRLHCQLRLTAVFVEETFVGA
jgi:FkbM family methyltransferase